MPPRSAARDADASVDARDVLDFFLRRGRFIASTTAILTLLALFILHAVTPLYTATSQVLLDPRREAVLGADSILSELTLDSSMVDSQVALLRSRSLLARVVAEEELLNDAEFADPARGVLGTLWTAVTGEADAEGAGVSSDVMAAVERLGSRLDVRREGRSYVISVSVTSADPSKAARIANGVADAHLTDQLEAGYDAARRASDWLSDRLEALRAELRASEDAVEKFRAENQLVATLTGTVTEQQLSELNRSW
jgi:succinoglycan biosynthesis transport protein ExoP